MRNTANYRSGPGRRTTWAKFPAAPSPKAPKRNKYLPESTPGLRQRFTIWGFSWSWDSLFDFGKALTSCYKQDSGCSGTGGPGKFAGFQISLALKTSDPSPFPCLMPSPLYYTPVHALCGPQNRADWSKAPKGRLTLALVRTHSERWSRAVSSERS